MNQTWSAWEYRDGFTVLTDEALVGFTVEATDGRVGTVSEATTETGSASLVVSPDDSGDAFVLPAGVVSEVDGESRRVYVDRTREEIAQAPGLHRDSSGTQFRENLADYYGGYYWTAPADAVSTQTRKDAAETE